MTLETEPQRLTDIVQRFVDAYESIMPKPWPLASASSDFIANLVGGIVGFTINVERLEGKWKLSQNHSTELQHRVIDGLRERNNGDDQKLANLMQKQFGTG